MRLKVLVALGMLGCISAALSVWSFTRSNGQRERPDARAIVTRAEAAARSGAYESRIDGEDTVRMRETVPVRSAEAGWRGSVVDPNGTAVRRALVEAFDGTHRVACETDDHGEFTLAWPADVVWSDRGRLVASGGGFVSAIVTDAAPKAVPDELRFVLQAGIPIQVRTVMSTSAVPAGGVVVTAFRMESNRRTYAEGYARNVTSQDGWAVLQLPDSGLYLFEVQNDGTACTGDKIERLVSTDKSNEPVILRVTAYPRSIHLFATDALSGRALGNAQYRMVERSYSGENESVEILPLLATRNGVLSLMVDDTSMPTAVVAEAPGYEPSTVLPIRDMDAATSVRLMPAGKTEARLEVHGEPYSGTIQVHYEFLPVLRFIPEQGDHGGWPRCLSEPMVRAVASGTGSVALPFHAAGTMPATEFTVREAKLKIYTPEGEREFGWLNLDELGVPPWKFELHPSTANVKLQVLGRDGRPLENVHVEVRAGVPEETQSDLDVVLRASLAYEPGERKALLLHASGRTDSEGIFQALLLAPCVVDWDLTNVLGEEIETTDVAVEPPVKTAKWLVMPDGTYDITITTNGENSYDLATGALQGHLIDLGGTATTPPPGATLFLVGERSAEAFTLTGDLEVITLGTDVHRLDLSEQGRFGAANIPVGRNVLMFFQQGVLVSSLPVDTTATDIEVPVSVTENYEILVIDGATSQALQGAAVKVVGKEGLGMSKTVDANGRCILEAVPTNYVGVWLSKNGYASTYVAKRELVPSLQGENIVSMEAGRNVVLRLSTTRDLVDAKVELVGKPAEAPSLFSWRPNRRGVVRLLAMTTSEIVLRIVGASGSIAAEDFHIPPGKDDIEIEF